MIVGIERGTLRRAYVRCSGRCSISGGSGVSKVSGYPMANEVKSKWKLFKFGLTRYLTKLLFIRGMGGNAPFYFHIHYTQYRR